MASKRKPARSTRRSAAPRDDDAQRARDVVLERIESQLQVVAEAVTSLSAQLDSKLGALEERLSARISVLEAVVRKNSEDIRKNSEDIRKNSDDIRKNSDDIRKNSDDIRALHAEVAQLRRDFEHRAELAQMKALEERVARVEAKLGIAS
jgi:chromosome segregation ATPase